jgi:hypothetical protein
MTKPLHQLLQTIFKNEHWKIKLLSEWNLITGNLSSKMRLEKIDGATLIIGVYQASWLQELYLLSSVLKQTINRHLGSDYIKQLRFKHASVQKKKEAPNVQKVDNVPVKKIVLSHNEQTALNTVKDEELKKALHGFLSRCHHQKVSS